MEKGGAVFISYRCQETWPAPQLYDLLVADLGADRVYKDVDNVEPGDDFVERIQSAWALPRATRPDRVSVAHRHRCEGRDASPRATPQPPPPSVTTAPSGRPSKTSMADDPACL
jgi:hypothetical protein